MFTEETQYRQNNNNNNKKKIIIITIIIIIIKMIILIIMIIIIIGPVAYKYWVGVQRGIAVSHGQEELFSLG